ncbi:MAG: trypsin-like peptidase domain-containing protein [Hyphomicrobiaceae bacterium]
MGEVCKEVASAARDIEALAGQLQLEALAGPIERFLDALARMSRAIRREDYAGVLKSLKDARAFDHLARVADHIQRLGVDDGLVARDQAQALIDSGQPVAAVPVLERIAMTTSSDQEAHIEALGLLGRAHKQIYVEYRHRPRPPAIESALRQAISRYASAYLAAADDKVGWLGINLVALIARARRDGVTLPSGVDAVPIVHHLLAHLQGGKAGGDEHWNAAVAGECYVALADAEAREGRHESARELLEKAAHWYGRYVHREDGVKTAFPLEGSLRQLNQVWGITAGRDAKGQLVAALNARLGEMRGGRLELSKSETQAMLSFAEMDDVVPQAVLGNAAPRRLSWLKQGLTAAAAVGRIVNIGTGLPVGTGFLVRGGDLAPSLGEELLLLTNAHVVGDPPAAPGIDIERAYVTFQEDVESRSRYRLTEVLMQSPFEALDYALVRLSPRIEHLRPLSLAPDLVADRLDDMALRHAFIIGHPAREELCISLNDTEVLDVGYKRKERIGDIYLRYRTPTMPGNSGSPVFDDNDWQVIAMHHAGPPQKGGLRNLGGRSGFMNEPANEGVALASIIQSIRSKYAVGVRGPAVAAAAPSAAGEQPAREALTPGELAAKLNDLDIPEELLAGHVMLDPGSDAFSPRIVPSHDPGTVQHIQRRDLLDGAETDGRAEPESALIVALAAINPIIRARRQAMYWRKVQRGGWKGLRFVAEGDSWFQYPIFVKDTIRHLSDDYAIYSLAGAGDTMRHMASSGDVLKAIEQIRPDGVLLSGGGNDLLGEGALNLYLRAYRPGDDPRACLKEPLEQAIGQVIYFYKVLIEDILRRDPKLKIFAHGYDRGWPDGESGRWLGLPMMGCGIKDTELQRAITAEIIERFSARLRAFEADYAGNFHFVDCLGAVGPVRERWYDELHPSDAGFAEVAQRFRQRIRSVLGG